VYSPFAGGRDAHACDLLTAVRSTRKEHGLTGPLFFMFMSNGGCFLHASMVSKKMLSPDGKFADLAEDLSRGGVIFDSSPVFLTITSGVKALATLNLSLIPRTLVVAAFYLVSWGGALATVVRTGGLAALPVKAFWKSVREAPGRRELYLYSDSDTLADSNKVAVGLLGLSGSV
jgi:hypothetical protein